MENKILVSQINWDITDGAEETTSKEMNELLETLPTEITLELKDLSSYGINMSSLTDEIKDAVSEYLSDTFGFCHNGFVLNI